MNNNLKSKPLVEGALLTGIIFILSLLTNLPGLYVLGNILVAIPVAVLYIKYKLKVSVLSVLVSAILVGISLGPVLGVYTIFYAGFIGIPLGYGIRNKKSGNTILFYLIISNIFVVVTTLLMSMYLFGGKGFMDGLTSMLAEFKSLSAQLSSIGANNPQAVKMQEMLANFNLQKLLILIPAGILIYSFISSIVSFIISKRILQKLGYKVNEMSSFSKWYIDAKVIASLIVIALIGLELKKNGVSQGETLFEAAWYIVGLLMVVQGLALASYFLREKLKLSRFTSNMVCVFLFLSRFVFFLVAFGLVDIILDYRGIDPNSLGSFIRRKVNIK